MAWRFQTPWKNYSLFDLDQFVLGSEQIYITHDRTCVFVAPRDSGLISHDAAIQQASLEKIQELWETHHLAALLAVLRIVQPRPGNSPNEIA